jgi:hypothetical protein
VNFGILISSLLGLFCFQKNFGFLLGAYGGLITVSTYFFARSHDNSVINIMPVLLFLLASTGGVLKEDIKNSFYQLMAPFFIIGLTLTYGLIKENRIFNDMIKYSIFNFPEAIFPINCDDEINNLLSRGINPESKSIVFYSTESPMNTKNCKDSNRNFIYFPLSPGNEIPILSEERRYELLKRFTSKLSLLKNHNKEKRNFYVLLPNSLKNTDPEEKIRRCNQEYLRIGDFIESKNWTIFEISTL